MRVLFTGSRDWTDEGPVRKIIDALPPDAVVIHGACFRKRKPGEPERSLDAIVDRLARERGLTVIAVPAEWDVHALGWCRCSQARIAARKHCPPAGNRRNQKMIDEHHPTECHAFPGPESRGTIDMAVRCAKAGIPGRAHGPFARLVREAVEKVKRAA